MAQLPVDEIARAVSGAVTSALNKISVRESKDPGPSQPGGSFGAFLMIRTIFSSRIQKRERQIKESIFSHKNIAYLSSSVALCAFVVYKIPQSFCWHNNKHVCTCMCNLTFMTRVQL